MLRKTILAFHNQAVPITATEYSTITETLIDLEAINVTTAFEVIVAKITTAIASFHLHLQAWNHHWA
jgi:hypothetical protein